MLFEITRNDGSKSRMRLLDPAASIEDELAKWHDDDRATVASWRRIREEDLTVRPAVVPPELDLTGVPEVVRDAILQMGSALVALQAQREQDKANHQAELDALHQRAVALETTHEAVRATLKI